MNFQELVEFTQKSQSSIKTNYPKFVTAMAKKGIFIERDSKFLDKANFTITIGEPKQIDSKAVSTRKYQTNLIQKEVWKTSCLGEDLEVSTEGRYRWVKEPNNFYKGGLSGEGYLRLTYEGKQYLIHRIILQTFKPIENWEDFTIDHKNGIRSDNRLENLEWVSNEENIMRMMLNRKELNQELTRIIQKKGYKKTLQLLKQL